MQHTLFKNANVRLDYYSDLNRFVITGTRTGDENECRFTLAGSRQLVNVMDRFPLSCDDIVAIQKIAEEYNERSQMEAFRRGYRGIPGQNPQRVDDPVILYNERENKYAVMGCISIYDTLGRHVRYVGDALSARNMLYHNTADPHIKRPKLEKLLFTHEVEQRAKTQALEADAAVAAAIKRANAAFEWTETTDWFVAATKKKEGYEVEYWELFNGNWYLATSFSPNPTTRYRYRLVKPAEKTITIPAPDRTILSFDKQEVTMAYPTLEKARRAFGVAAEYVEKKCGPG